MAVPTLKPESLPRAKGQLFPVPAREIAEPSDDDRALDREEGYLAD